MNIVELEAKIWEKIRACQAKGIQVRPGGLLEYEDGRSPGTLCLLGAIGAHASVTGSIADRWAQTHALLGISAEEAELLEWGFEDWSPHSHSSVALARRQLDGDRFHELGRKIARELLELKESAGW